LTFAARRQIPTKYNRELATTTLRAMERVAEIRARRERVYYKHRMEGNKERAMAAAKKLIEMDERYKMFAETDNVEEKDLMALDEEEKWVSSDEEDAAEETSEVVKVKVPIVVQRNKKRHMQMEVDE